MARTAGSHSMVLRHRRKFKSRNNTKNWDFDLQKWLNSLGMEFHWPGYQFMGPGTRLKDRLRSSQTGVNRLDRLALIHDLKYMEAKNLQDKHRADREMIKGIQFFGRDGSQTWTEWTVEQILKAKVAWHI